MNDELLSVTDSIRDVANNTAVEEFRRQFMLTDQSFNRFWAAMDAIEDAHEALQAYPRIFNDDIGTAYLAIFGAMQSLSLQQDALRTLSSVLSIPNNLKDDESIRPIRLARNWLTHQTDPYENNNHHAVSIIRISIAVDSCELIRWGINEDLDEPLVNLNLLEFIGAQTKFVIESLKTMHLIISEKVKSSRR